MKRYVCALLCSSMLLSLFGCAKEQPESKVAETTQTPADTESTPADTEPTSVATEPAPIQLVTEGEDFTITYKIRDFLQLVPGESTHADVVEIANSRGKESKMTDEGYELYYPITEKIWVLVKFDEELIVTEVWLESSVWKNQKTSALLVDPNTIENSQAQTDSNNEWFYVDYQVEDFFAIVPGEFTYQDVIKILPDFASDMAMFHTGRGIIYQLSKNLEIWITMDIELVVIDVMVVCMGVDGQRTSALLIPGNPEHRYWEKK